MAMTIPIMRSLALAGDERGLVAALADAAKRLAAGADAVKVATRAVTRGAAVAGAALEDGRGRGTAARQRGGEGGSAPGGARRRGTAAVQLAAGVVSAALQRVLEGSCHGKPDCTAAPRSLRCGTDAGS